ncbi:uncharacterized protein [Spinacia oleracea]|uniref:Aminotransferase-like plant mobile domain-containing protein n=1 Tax=Spinacia oleracea TaxID=3562 RepID=A0ABM3QKB6_SPIOL|nr:uncharacterized protein LOC110784818 [Spinacia oleracea]XP_056683800.1 uncharacterized protein LOC110784818 [Spinacia oleracea]
MGFGGLLHIDLPFNTPFFAGDLVWNFDTNSMCILLERNKEIHIIALDVYLVYGIPLGGHKIIEAKDDEESFVELVAALKSYHGTVDVPSLTDIAAKLVKADVDDNWKRSFLVLAVNSCIKSTTNPQPLLRFLSTSYDTNRIHEFNWCQYALQSLVDGTVYWKKETSRFFTGPLPFLMVCYFDRLKRLTFDPPRTFPLISAWNKNVVKERVDLELTFGFGLGTLLERIEAPFLVQKPQQSDVQHHRQEQPQHDEQQDLEQSKLPASMEEFMHQFGEVTSTIANGFVKLTNLLAIGEKISPGNIFKEDMAFNLANMWSKCSGSHLPSELNLMTQGGSRSLLSQDIDLYSSIWFANVMDEIVRKEIGKEQVPQQDQLTNQHQVHQEPFLDQSNQQSDTSFELNLGLRVASSSEIHINEFDLLQSNIFIAPEKIMQNQKIKGQESSHQFLDLRFWFSTLIC